MVLQLLGWARGPGKRDRRYSGVQAELQGHFLSSLCCSLCSLGASDSPFLSFALGAVLSQIGVLCPEQGWSEEMEAEVRGDGSLAKLQREETAIRQVLCDCKVLVCIDSSRPDHSSDFRTVIPNYVWMRHRVDK